RAQPLWRCGTAGITRVLVASLRVGCPTGHEPARATTCQSALASVLVSGLGMALRRVGCCGTVHGAAERSRCRTPVELVSAPARLDYNRCRPDAACWGDPHRKAASTDALRSPRQQEDCVDAIEPETAYQVTRTLL